MNSASEGYWRSRGYLPHLDDGGKVQHVTLHLADSLPKEALKRMEFELDGLPPKKRRKERMERLEAWVDAGHGSCVLREPEVAEMVQRSLLHFDAERYRLIAWVVMPNHLHVLFQPMEGWDMSKTVAAWKKFTARRILDFWRATGKVAFGPGWMPIGRLALPVASR